MPEISVTLQRRVEIAKRVVLLVNGIPTKWHERHVLSDSDACLLFYHKEKEHSNTPL